ncbi:MAG: hypothetical protein WC623_18580 [Pedobacter sp.]|uniref:hypothetical protein n=1 Tax=Pedobacter sp. TaxID=1411316 RepID=UPI003561ED8C
MISNFEEYKRRIEEIKNGSFNGNMVPISRSYRKLIEEADQAALGNRKEAIEYLNKGVAILKDMISNIAEDRIGTSRENARGFHLELVEVEIVKMNEHFSDLLTKRENN